MVEPAQGDDKLQSGWLQVMRPELSGGITTLTVRNAS